MNYSWNRENFSEFARDFFNRLHNHIPLDFTRRVRSTNIRKLTTHFLWIGCKMADGNWYGVGATRAMGCTQCTCEARDYVYCVDLCPGKYTNGTKESFKKSCNYHFFYCDMFVIKYRLILYQIALISFSSRR